MTLQDQARLAQAYRLAAEAGEVEPPLLVPPLPKPAALTLPWSPLARMVIAINIDRVTPGGIR